MSIFRKTVIQRIDTDEVVQDVLRELTKKKIPKKKILQELPPTIQVKWANKKKGLIVCNQCGGKGREPDPYGSTRVCRFCGGTKVINLKIV
jgi:hypothetical protein